MDVYKSKIDKTHLKDNKVINTINKKMSVRERLKFISRLQKFYNKSACKDCKKLAFDNFAHEDLINNFCDACTEKFRGEFKDYLK